MLNLVKRNNQVKPKLEDKILRHFLFLDLPHKRPLLIDIETVISITFGTGCKLQKKKQSGSASLPNQTKILKNALKRTIGNRECGPFTLIKKMLENAFISVFCSFLGVKTVKILVFER